MPKTYKASLNVFGLRTGDTFTTDEPGWDKYVEKGLLSLEEDTDVVQGESAEGSGLGGEEGSGEEGAAGPGEGEE